MKWLFHNFGKKIISIILAGILWLFVNSSIAVVQQKTIDITYQNIPNDLILIEAPEKISYSIKTNPYYPSDIKSNISLSVSLDNTTQGWHVLPIQVTYDTPLPSYAKVILSSERVRVFLDNKGFKNLIIKPTIEIASKNQNDYTIKNIKVTPEVTMVNGPQSIISNFTNIGTDTITVYKLGHYKVNKKIALPSKSVTAQDTEVSVEFTVDNNIISKTITLPISINNLNPSLGIRKMSRREVKVTLSGLKSQIDELESDNDSKAFSIDLSTISSKGRYLKIPVIKDFPDGVTILSSKTIPPVDIIVDSAASTKEVTSPTPSESDGSNQNGDLITPTPNEEKETDSSVEKPIDTSIEKSVTTQDENPNIKPSQKDESNNNSDVGDTVSSEKKQSSEKSKTVTKIVNSEKQHLNSKEKISASP